MRITQGSFSFLPDLTDEQIKLQIEYCLRNDWPVSVEHTDDPHPRNVYWDMFGLPMFDLADPAAIMLEINACRKAFPQRYVRVTGYDRSYGSQTSAISFLVQRPSHEPGFRLDRQEVADRQIRYSVHAYATDRPEGERYPATDADA